MPRYIVVLDPDKKVDIRRLCVEDASDPSNAIKQAVQKFGFNDPEDFGPL